MQLPLQGLQVLVTRPAHQAGRFANLLTASGAQPKLFPVIAIEAVSTAPASLLALHQQAYDWVIFISANAVECGLSLLADSSCLAPLKLGAIGKQTASTLKRYGLNPAVVPEQGFTSEDFLAAPELQELHRQRVLIVRGDAGREVLAATLTERGAQVSYANVYQRCLTGSAAELKQLHANQQLDIICITSSEILHKLLQHIPAETWIYQLPLVVGSERIAITAQQLGFNNRIMVATSPADDDMLAALLKWQQGK
ncbi:MAG: uroporphyrinogen-III synthase [Thiothrix sp.]|nr:MAG: uroporphyrinogen-III synthase [Thiothrix sp.]